MSLWGLFSAARGDSNCDFCREEDAVVEAVSNDVWSGEVWW